MSEPEKKGETSDVLDEAFGALRSSDFGEVDDAATRRAVLLGAKKKRRQRLIVMRVLLPLAAVLAISTAWAAATKHLPRAVTELFAPERSGPPQYVPVPVTTRELPPAPVATVITSVEKPAIEDTPFAPPPPVTVTVVKPTPPPPVASNAADPEEALYRAAHDKHFTEHDWNAALAGWDAYLAAHPKGRFAPEARYNRALILVRLGRRDEAKAALTPFADGTLGGYRQREAKDLLDAMK